MINVMYEYPCSSAFPGFIVTDRHCYYMSCTGTKGPTGYYDTRVDAECAMNGYCQAHHIKIECTEKDKHERKYSDHHGVRFYINRV